MKLRMLIGIAAMAVMIATLSVAATAVVLYSQNWESYPDNYDITGGGVPGWEAVGDWGGGQNWQNLDGETIRVYSGLYPSWGKGLSANYAGGYYNGYKTTVVRVWFRNVLGSQPSGQFEGTFKVSPIAAEHPDYPAAQSWIGLGSGWAVQIATWEFVAQPSYPTSTGGLKLVYAGGESAVFDIDGNDPNTLLKVNLDLDAHTVSGSITQGTTVQNTPVFSIPAGTTFDMLGFYENKTYTGGNFGFDIDDLSVVRLGGPGNITGSITLGNYSGDLQLVPIRIELLQGGSVVRTELITPTANPQSYTLASLTPGTYDVRFTAQKCLRKVVSVQVVEGGETLCSPALINGDLNGDNQITNTDVNLVLSHLGEGRDQ